MRVTDIFESVSLSPAIVKAATDYLVQLLDGSASARDFIAFEMGCRDEPYDGDTDEKCYQENLPSWCDDAIHNAFWTIQNRFQNGKLTIWREITAPADWKPDNRVHRYWSWDKDAAEAHWGDFSDSHVKWLLHAEVSFDQIDWPSTLAQNAFPDMQEEREITINAPVPFTYERMGK